MMMGYRDVVQSAMRSGSPDRIAFYEEYIDLLQHSRDDYRSPRGNYSLR